MQAPSMTPTDTAATASVRGWVRNRPAAAAAEGVVQRHVRTADRRGPRPAVGLEDVTVDRDLHLPSATRSQTARNDRAIRRWISWVLPIACLWPPRVTPAPLSSRQHGVFGSHPALAAPAHPRRHAVLDRGRAEHPGPAHRDEDRPGGEHRVVALEVTGRRSSSWRPSARRTLGSVVTLSSIAAASRFVRWCPSCTWPQGW